MRQNPMIKHSKVAMCGRYEAGQKQKIAEAFHVSVTLDDIYFSAGLECAPGSVQPVIYMRDCERQIGEIRWGTSDIELTRAEIFSQAS